MTPEANQLRPQGRRSFFAWLLFARPFRPPAIGLTSFMGLVAAGSRLQFWLELDSLTLKIPA